MVTMAFSARTSYLVVLLVSVCVCSHILVPVNAHKKKITKFGNSSKDAPPMACFPGVFTFGDSLADNGNSMAMYPEKFGRLLKDPYGKTWPGHGSDRFCDGKLLGDYIAWGLGLYPMSAYLRSLQYLFTLGVNLAAAGSTVLPDLVRSPILQSDGTFPHTPFTLKQQVEWYDRFKYRTSALAENRFSTQAVLSLKSFNSSLHLIFAGYTDYIVQTLSRVPEQQILASVPKVVTGISDVVETLHTTDGVKNILVVNLPPLGCTPGFLTLFPGKRDDYDQYGCLRKYNEIIRLHNKQLLCAVIELQENYPALSLTYGDYYRTVQDILQRPLTYGFTDSCHLLTACCGAGGKYNFDLNVTCGIQGYVEGELYNGTACDNPSGRLFWDGFHPTGAVNRLAVLSFLNGTNIYPAGGLTPKGCNPSYSYF